MDVYSIFCNMKVCCMFLLESENLLELSQICSYWTLSKGLKNEFEAAVVNEPSVFETLKFFCVWVKFKSRL